jgi:hypothetical protein
MMQIQVTDIVFDFECDDEIPSQDYQDNITKETLTKIWEVEDEDDLANVISDCFGWCVQEIEYTLIN